MRLIDALMPCAVCGEKPKISWVVDRGCCEYKLWCSGCAVHNSCGDWFRNKYKACKDWNRRQTENLDGNLKGGELASEESEDKNISEKDAVILRSMIANGFEFRKNHAEINGKEYEIEELERIALLGDEIIKKAIPQKPEVKEKPLIGGTIWFVCPNCNANTHSRFRLGHCTHCGQKLDWSEYLTAQIKPHGVLQKQPPNDTPKKNGAQK